MPHINAIEIKREFPSRGRAFKGRNGHATDVRVTENSKGWGQRNLPRVALAVLPRREPALEVKLEALAISTL
jgi:hypothetical protein